MGLPRLRIVVYPETTKAWGARSLEHDLSAVGRTAEAALDALVRIASAHIAYDSRHGRAPLSAFAAAPRPYWNAFAVAAQSARPLEIIRPEPQGAMSCLVSVTREHPAMRRLIPPRIA